MAKAARGRYRYAATWPVPRVEVPRSTLMYRGLMTTPTTVTVSTARASA